VSRSRLRSWSAIALVVFLPLAGRSAEPAPGIQDGPWHAWLDSPGGALPFDLELRTGETGLSARISNGNERVVLPDVRLQSDNLVVEIPVFHARIEATVSADGKRLDGAWSRDEGEPGMVEVPLHATAGSAPRFPPEEGAAPDDRPLPERWAVQLEDWPLPSVGVFHVEDGGRTLGSVLQISGDYRDLEGEFRNGRLRLSRFDGGQPFLFDARMQADGTLEGRFWIGSRTVKRWSARPDPDAHLQDPFAYLRVDTSPDLDALVAYDLEGTPRSLAEVRPPGRALLIEILGTWCPHCRDASTFLARLQSEYGPQGLDVLGLAFQLSGDFERNVGDLQRYRKRYGADYPMLLASNSAPVSPEEFFPPLSGSFAFPTFLFLDRRGRVRAAYTGFRDAAAGSEHEAMKARWQTLIEQILRESG